VTDKCPKCGRKYGYHSKPGGYAVTVCACDDSTPKVREWWLNLKDETINESGLIIYKAPLPSPSQIVHVVEAKAYAALKKERDELANELDHRSRQLCEFRPECISLEQELVKIVKERDELKAEVATFDEINKIQKTYLVAAEKNEDRLIRERDRLHFALETISKFDWDMGERAAKIAREALKESK
jgi:hypothetical protein